MLQAQQRLKSLPSLVDVPVAEGNCITVCGDVHGQYYDLLNIFELNGMPSEDNPYLFNGEVCGCSGKTGGTCGHDVSAFGASTGQSLQL